MPNRSISVRWLATLTGAALIALSGSAWSQAAKPLTKVRFEEAVHFATLTIQSSEGEFSPLSTRKRCDLEIAARSTM